MIDYLNTKELEALLKDFHLLTGIKIAVFDTNYNEVAAYPISHCEYCNLFQSNSICRSKCLESNLKSFQHCKQTSSTIIYHCHAGLVEATAPLIDNGFVIGYIMFGQITDISDSEKLLHMVHETLMENHLDYISPISISPSIVSKTTDQIYAAAKILEACTFYVLLKHLMSVKRENFRNNLDSFLLAHLEEEITADRLAKEFCISRSKLYECCDKNLSCGIAKYIKIFRLEQAKKLLGNTDFSVMKISEMVGFSDYNYFCRVFKSYESISAKKYHQITNISNKKGSVAK